MFSTHLEHAVDAEGVLELIVGDGVALVPVEMRKRVLEPCASTRGKQPSETKFEFECDNVTVWTFMTEGGTGSPKSPSDKLGRLFAR